MKLTGLRCDGPDCDHETTAEFPYGWLRVDPISKRQLMGLPQGGDFCSLACLAAWAAAQDQSGAESPQADHPTVRLTVGPQIVYTPDTTTTGPVLRPWHRENRA